MRRKCTPYPTLALGPAMAQRFEPGTDDPDLGRIVREINRRLAGLGTSARVEVVNGDRPPAASGLRIVAAGSPMTGSRTVTVRLDPDRSPGWVERAVGRILERLPAPTSAGISPPAAGAAIDGFWCDPP